MPLALRSNLKTYNVLFGLALAALPPCTAPLPRSCAFSQKTFKGSWHSNTVANGQGSPLSQSPLRNRWLLNDRSLKLKCMPRPTKRDLQTHSACSLHMFKKRYLHVPSSLIRVVSGQ
ncbi:hypothetical protein F5887DRAFT_957186, partial [Amanita rubescens]